MRILISRIDAIGDVVLTLPMAGLIKKTWPTATVGFLCQSYTQDVVSTCAHVDEIYNWKEISKNGPEAAASALRALAFDVVVHAFPNREVARAAKKAGIARRVGTSRRLFHWLTCNTRVNYSRRNSDLHEAQLNCQLLLPLGVNQVPSLAELSASPSLAGMSVEKWWPEQGPAASFKNDGRRKIILHPGSRGSASNWPLDSFHKLARELSAQNVLVFLTGTEAEGKAFRSAFSLDQLPFVVDVSGTMSLAQLMGFIASCNALVAASTGPLHLAAAFGIRAVGIYPPLRPMHPGRWGPLGKNVCVLTNPAGCMSCPDANACPCLKAVSPQKVLEQLV